MQVTIFGGIVVLVGLLLMFGSTLAMLCFVLIASLFGGSAAIVLSSLGGSSITPGNLALVFLVLRCILPSPGQAVRVEAALIANRTLLVFGVYGAIGSWLLPHVFRGAVAVTPLHPVDIAYIYALSPLTFSSQNVTVSFYMTGTVLAAICGYMAGTRERAGAAVVRVAAVIAMIHAALGIASVPFGGTPVFTFFRNGNYAQLNQSLEGIVRMNGIWAEPATYAAYGVVWMILTGELWFRGIDRRWTMPAFIAITAALLLSTSTTAYVGIGAYGLVLALRQMITPGTVPVSAWLGAIVSVAALVCIVLLALVLDNGLLNRLNHVTAVLVTDKLQSRSGLQRLFWAKQGLTAFAASYGFGIGPGSFRSSSLLTAILGSTGVIGSVAFLLYMVKLLGKAVAPAAVQWSDDQAVGQALAWTVCLMLVPAFVAAPSPDPGYVWGLLSGLALALRADVPAASAPPNRYGPGLASQLARPA